MYLCSAGYDPQREHTIDPLDPALGIAWPQSTASRSCPTRDRAAPTLAAASDAGLLPTWEDAQAFVESLRRELGDRPLPTPVTALLGYPSIYAREDSPT